MNIVSQFKSLNPQNKRYVSFGLLTALLVALPLSVWAITTGTFDIRERAQETNSCGGTCGSNYNCNSELYCYQGFCRNPLCKDSADCDCSTPIPTATATVKPTTKPTLKPSPTASATATLVASPSATPIVASTPSAKPTQTPTPEAKTSFPYAYLIGTALFVLVLFIFLSFRKKGNGPKPPISQINPPVEPQAPPTPAQQEPGSPVAATPPAIPEPEQQPEQVSPPTSVPPSQDQY